MRGDCRKKEDQHECPIHRGCFPIIIGPTGPTGPTGPAGGPTGATGPTHPVKSVKYPNF